MERIHPCSNRRLSWLFAIIILFLHPSVEGLAATNFQSRLQNVVANIDQADYKKSENELRSIIADAHAADSTFREAESRSILGQYLMIKGDPAEAFEQMSKSLDLAAMLQNPIQAREIRLMNYNGLGMYYIIDKGNYYLGKEYMLKAAKLATEAQDLRLIRRIETNLIQAALIRRDTTVRSRAEDLLRWAESSGDKSAEYHACIELSQLKAFSDDLAGARDLISRAEKIGRDMMAGDRVPYYLTLADIQGLEGNYALADSTLRTASAVLDDGNEAAFFRSIIASRRAQLQLDAGNFSEALRLATEARDITQRSGQRTNIPSILLQISQAYEGLGDTRNALLHARIYEQYLDSITSGEKEYMVQTLNSSYDVDRKTLETKIALQDLSRVQQRNVMLAIGIALLAALLGVVIWAYVRQRSTYRRMATLSREAVERETTVHRSMDDSLISIDTEPCIDNFSDINERIWADLMKLIDTTSDWSDDSLGRESVAAALGTNRTYLSRAVKAHSGRSYSQFINHIRINRAIEILSDPDKASYPLKTLASDLGFGSINAFYANFKSETGMSPAMFRRSL